MNWPGTNANGWPSARSKARWRTRRREHVALGEAKLEMFHRGDGLRKWRSGQPAILTGSRVPPALPSSPHPMTNLPALDVVELKKTYANGVEALKGISLTVQPGDFFALLGPNGAGKSTLIGIVVLAGQRDQRRRQDLRHVDPRRSAAQAMRLIGLVPQELNFNLFEKPFDICVNQAGFYGIPRAEAQRARREISETTGALGQGVPRRAHDVRRHEAAPDDRARDDERAETADPRRADRRRRHRDPPLDVEIHQCHQRGRHHGDPDHALPGGSRAAVPQHRDHRPRPHHREHLDEAPAGPSSTWRPSCSISPVRSAMLPNVADVTLTRVDDHTLEAEMSREHDLNSLFAALVARTASRCARCATRRTGWKSCSCAWSTASDKEAA